MLTEYFSTCAFLTPVVLLFSSLLCISSHAHVPPVWLSRTNCKFAVIASHFVGQSSPLASGVVPQLYSPTFFPNFFFSLFCCYRLYLAHRLYTHHFPFYHVDFCFFTPLFFSPPSASSMSPTPVMLCPLLYVSEVPLMCIFAVWPLYHASYAATVYHGYPSVLGCISAPQ